MPPPLLLRPLAVAEALKVNRAIPFSTDQDTPARPFQLATGGPSFDRAVECLASAIYYEAATEPLNGQRAVAQVVLNRARHPAFVPSVCGVVYQGSTRSTGCQFSFTCDGSMRRRPSVSGWAKARAIAVRAITGAVFAPVGHATHYHADYVVPYWATSLAKSTVIGRHIFYRWPEWLGTPAAFSSKYSGQEPDPRLLRAIALRRPVTGPPGADARPAQLVLKTDPRVELVSIVRYLAGGSPLRAPPNAHEAEVRRHFSSYSEHLSVQIYRQLADGNKLFESEGFVQLMMHYSEPPQLEQRSRPTARLIEAAGGAEKLAGFMAALRDFANRSAFETFMNGRRADYVQLASEARMPALASLETLELDAAPEPHVATIILAPLLSRFVMSTCQDVANEGAQGWLILGVREGVRESFDNPAHGRMARNTFERSRCKQS